MENIESGLKLSKVKRVKLSEMFEKLSSLASQGWKEAEDHLESTESMLVTLFEQVRERENEVVSKEKKMEDKESWLSLELEEVEVKKQEIKTLNMLIQMKCKEIEIKEKQYASIKVSIDEKKAELDSIEKSIVKATKRKYESIKRVEEKEKTFGSLQEALENCQRVSEFEPRQNEFELLEVKKSFEEEDMGLQLLNKHLKKHDSVCREIASILRNSLNPAKLVLEAIKSKYCFLQTDQSSLQRNRILLLPQMLIEVSPEINPLVRVEATELAREMKAKNEKNPLDVLGYLKFLVSYRLTSVVDQNELRSLLDSVGLNCQSRSFQAPENAVGQITTIVGPTSRRTSSVWVEFTLVKTRNENGSYSKAVQCKICNKKLVYTGGTTSMRNHLSGVHKRC